MIPHFSMVCPIAVALATIASAAAGQALTEGESLRRGLARSEVAELARSRVDAAVADAQEAGLWANPTLEYSRDGRRSAASPLEESWRLAQPFDLSGRRGLKREAGHQRTAAAAADTRQFRAERTAEIRRGFFQLLLREAQFAAVDAWAGRFAAIERIVGKLRAAGEASGYDLRRLAREHQAAQARRAETRAELERAHEQFAALIGTDSGRYAGLSGRLPPDAPGALPALVAQLDRRADLAALNARAAAAELEERAARRGWVPEATLGVGTKRSDDSFNRQDSTLVSVALTLPLFDRQQAAENRAAAQAMALRAELGLAHSRAAGEVRGLHAQATHLVAAASAYRRAAVAPSADLVHIAEAAYRAGESGILELLDAYKGALDAEYTALDLEWKARAAQIELDLATGSHSE